MRARVGKWGNSLAVRIPRAFAEEIGVDEDTEVEMTVTDEALVVAPVRVRRYALENLLERVTEENLHDEVDTGRSVGREAW